MTDYLEDWPFRWTWDEDYYRMSGRCRICDQPVGWVVPRGIQAGPYKQVYDTWADYQAWTADGDEHAAYRRPDDPDLARRVMRYSLQLDHFLEDECSAADQHIENYHPTTRVEG